MIYYKKIISYLDYYVRYLESLNADVDSLGNIRASAILYNDILYVAESHRVIWDEGLHNIYKSGIHYDCVVNLRSGNLISIGV